MHPDGETRIHHPRIPPHLLARAVSRRSALLRDRVDGVTAEVFQALDRAGIRGLLLKGPATVSWLYDDENARRYGDVDVLVAPDDMEPAGVVLPELGFRLVFDERDHLPHPHAQMWSRSGSPDVDLHWQLPGIDTEPGEAWRLLSSRTERLSVGGVEVEILGAPARALHLAIHAAYHQQESRLARQDLELAVARLETGVWADAAALARRLGAEPAVGAGLRQVPHGVALADELGLSRADEGYWALAGGLGAPGALGLHRVMSTGSTTGAARMLLRELFPPPSYMRAVSPSGTLGPAGLVAAYARRLVRGAGGAPAAIMAARRSRRLERRRSKARGA